MTSIYESIFVLAITLIIVYILLCAILSYTWNQSIVPIFNIKPISILDAFFLLITLHILFRTFPNTITMIKYNVNK